MGNILRFQSAIYISGSPEIFPLICFIILPGVWGSILGSPSHMADILPLYHAHRWLPWILSEFILSKCNFSLTIIVLRDENCEFESAYLLQLRIPLSTWTGLGIHTLGGSWYTTPLHPSIYPIWLYIRGYFWLGIFILATWLYQFSCGSIDIFAYQFLRSIILR